MTYWGLENADSLEMKLLFFFCFAISWVLELETPPSHVVLNSSHTPSQFIQEIC